MNFLFTDRRIVKSSGLFDEKFYLQNNPDVRMADVDPLKHFMTIGWKESRKPSENFDVRFYLVKNPDVKEAGVNPVVHYIRHGMAEGRLPLPSSSRALPNMQPNVGIPFSKLFTRANIRRGVSYIKNYGFRLFFKNAKRHLFPDRGSLNTSNNLSVTIVHVDSTIHSNQKYNNLSETHDVKISVVIPTKDAGGEFLLLVKMLLAQKGFRELEVLIVDSGSTDETVQIAEEFGVIVIKIPPEEFSHSYARNLGAEKATGDYIFFTVQDALPPNETFLLELYLVLAESRAVAVSCAETPREDADLFYQQINWNHYNFLGINESDRIFSLPEKQDYVSLRQQGQLSDIANLISRDVFNRYGFRLNYAEDLDLGIRLIKDDFKLAFLGSTRIIHSHNRPPYYFLKRGFVDNMYLSDIFEDFTIPKVKLESFVPDLAYAVGLLDEINGIVDSVPSPMTPLHLEQTLLNLIDSYQAKKFLSKKPEAVVKHLDYKTTEFVDKLIVGGGMKYQSKFYDGIMLPAMRGQARLILNYLKSSYELINSDLKEDIKSSFAKSFSIMVGTHLSYCYKNRDGKENLDMDALYATLMEGV